MNLRQLLNRPEKPKPKKQWLFARSNKGYCIVLIDYHNQLKALNSTYKLKTNTLYQCYSPTWHGHNGFNNYINKNFIKLYNQTNEKGFWNISGKELTLVSPEEFPYKEFLEYKEIEEIEEELIPAYE